ncbi:MAG TPA: serine/threonine-protein kinase [Polyangiaceae bacterium]|nr:serine/threonine-protein kinase [Polyangiaceae bacterium]
MSAPISKSEPQVLAETYALGRRLGEGHAAVVYEAEHLVVGKRVAIKLLRARVTETGARLRFVAETRAAARILHPNVVDIHDLGIAPDGTPYVVMELLAGETVASLTARKGALPIAQAVEITFQILSGLSAAHRKGIIHGDLRPENVIVMQPRSDQVLVKLLDFGASRALPEAAPLSSAALLYQAPEQLEGNVDERSDVYAAAAVLSRLVRGPAPEARAEAQLPKQLVELIERGLAKKRNERIPSADEFAEQLRTVLAATPSMPNSTTAGAHQVAVVARRPPGTDASKPPDSAVLRVNLSPRLVTDSLLMSPRLPRAPAPPKLEAGKDFLPMLGDPERDSEDAFRSAPTRTPESERRRLDPRPALLAMAIGFGIGMVIAWLAGLI